MTTQLPAPMTPVECDLQDFEFMPVMVRRLLKSDTWALGSGEERAAAVALWFESWHQVPAASLPSNDRLLSRLADTSKWPRVKSQALRGWVECSDGRLYHPVVAEKALEAWIEKLLNSISGAAGNAKRWNISIDAALQRDQFGRAVDLLRKLAPQSKTLKKKSVLTIMAGSPPESPPDSQPDSDGDRKGQGEGQGLVSEAKASGGKPPKSELSPDAILFGYGVPYLIETGCKESNARSFIGKLRKLHGDETVIDKLRACMQMKVSNPIEWLSAALPPEKAPAKVEWNDTQSGIEDMGESLGLGRWDEAGYKSRGFMQADSFLAYKARVIAEHAKGAH